MRVSAVIPTRNRPVLVCRAVASVLAQTVLDVEVIVVVDGVDEATVSALQALNNPRVRCIALQQNVGGSEARNIGIREARGIWIALLDDDDEWLPDKIGMQLALALKLGDPYAVIMSQYFAQTDTAREIQPRIIPRPNQPISEYLFCETTLKGARHSFLQTSSWFVSRELFLETPFTKGLKRNQDTDWLLHVLPTHERGSISSNILWSCFTTKARYRGSATFLIGSITTSGCLRTNAFLPTEQRRIFWRRSVPLPRRNKARAWPFSLRLFLRRFGGIPCPSNVSGFVLHTALYFPIGER